jgi:hypothetical protein
MPAIRRRFHRYRLALALWLAAGCADGSPAASEPLVPPPAPVMAALACAADVRAATLACRAPGATLADGVSAALLGGQNQYVRLESSGVSYDGSSVFSADVTVQNLVPQVLGTRDDRTPAPEGIRIFFHSGPSVTAGSGTVSVANADGLGAFTGADQPFFQYVEPLATGAVSVPRTWEFSVPNTVQTFEFVVYVAAPVRRESGWIEFSHAGSGMYVGSEGREPTTLRGITGAALAAQPIDWSTSSPAVATVDASGTITGISVGTAVITATSGSRSGSLALRVYPEPFPVSVQAENGHPSIYRLIFMPGFGRANGADSMEVAVQASGFEVGLVSVSLRSPSGMQYRNCSVYSPHDTVAFYCNAGVLAEDTELGLWQVDSVSVDDEAFSGVELEAAGAATVFQVRAANTPAPPVCGLQPFSPPECVVPGTP